MIDLLVTPAELSEMKPGERLQLKAKALMPDGSIEDVTAKAAYSSTGATRAIVSTSGEIRVPAGALTGTVYIKIGYYGKVVTRTLTVMKPSPVGITITPGTSLEMKPGEIRQLNVEALMSDGSTEDVTAKAAYSSTDASRVIISASGEIRVPAGALTGTVYIKIGYNGKVATCTLIVTKASPVGITATPVALGIMKPGDTQQLKVEALMSDGSTEDVTTKAAYSSTDATRAIVSAGGEIRVPVGALIGIVYIKVGYYGNVVTYTLKVVPDF